MRRSIRMISTSHIRWAFAFFVAAACWTDSFADAFADEPTIGGVLTPEIAAESDLDLSELVDPMQLGDPNEREFSSEPGVLRFSFNGVPWREVIKWLADESDLALHIDGLPTGSFTYSDLNPFTSQEAIDRVNLFLVSEGFTLIKSGNLLSLIDLADPRSTQKLDVLAKLISVDDLDSGALEGRGYDVVKCMFPLGEINASDAVQEISPLGLMSAPKILSKTNQLLVVDTVSKLMSVRKVLLSFAPSTMDNGTIIKSFTLEHVQAEDILIVARPHLGLATDEMIGIDVSLSSDLLGKNIFVTGVEDKVKLIEGIILAVDRPKASKADESGEMELRSHFVEGGNVQTVYNVLLTLLAGKTVRLSMDETAGSVVALATPAVQAEIAQTVTQLQASEADFEVIPLKTVDPYFAISLLGQMLKLPGPLDDPEDFDPDTPQIDADPGNMRLFVRAKKHQIEQIKKIVAGLENGETSPTLSDTRVLPLKGREAEQLLETAAKFWRSANPILLFPSNASAVLEVGERVPGGEAVDTSPSSGTGRSTDTNSSTGTDLTQATHLLDRGSAVVLASSQSHLDTTVPRLLTAGANSRLPAIQCQVTPRGLMLQCEDTSALDRLEEHLRTLAGPVESLPSPPVVFYLKHTKPDDALQMLGDLIDGGEAAKESESGTLVNGFVSSGGSSDYFSPLVTSRDGTTTMISGAITVVADSRLNRLIAQGTTADIELIEAYLKIIDKDSSITSIETYGTSHVIELKHSNASEVAESIREAFADRVAGDSKKQGQPTNPQQAAIEAAAKIKELAEAKSKGLKTPETPPKNLEPKLTVAVHDASNSLIITAPQQLFEEVEKLVQIIDSRGEKFVEVISPVNGEMFGAILQQVLLGEEVNSNRSSSSRSESSSRSRTER